MASGPGHLDQLGNACLKFHLCGVIHEEPGLEFIGIIDTGFTGFIQLPIQHAFSLKLPLEATASYTLADGSQTACLTALARTTFAGQMKVGAVTLVPGSKDILIGMGFLRQFKLGLLLFKKTVMLIDEAEIEKLGQDRQKAQAVSSSPPAPAEPDEPPRPQ